MYIFITHTFDKHESIYITTIPSQIQRHLDFFFKKNAIMVFETIPPMFFHLFVGHSIFNNNNLVGQMATYFPALTWAC